MKFLKNNIMTNRKVLGVTIVIVLIFILGLIIFLGFFKKESYEYYLSKMNLNRFKFKNYNKKIHKEVDFNNTPLSDKEKEEIRVLLEKEKNNSRNSDLTSDQENENFKKIDSILKKSLVSNRPLSDKEKEEIRVLLEKEKNNSRNSDLTSDQENENFKKIDSILKKSLVSNRPLSDKEKEEICALLEEIQRNR